MNYKFQFITLAGFHALNYAIFDLAKNYKADAMSAYSVLQEKEFAAEKEGYRAIKHQAFVGTGYFDDVAQVIAGGASSTTALHGSTEKEQFHEQDTCALAHDCDRRVPLGQK
jgi:isocitrate lyase